MYQQRLRQANALDFDDLIMTTVNLLQAFPDVAEHYRRRFRHVLVDEYQDTNHAQYVLVRELVGAGDDGRVPPAELCVVGDADQSIYAFRGATIRNIVEFEDDYPRRDDDPARAELPLHPDHPDRGQRGHRAQPRPPAEEPLDRRRRRASRSSATSPTTSTTRPPSSPSEIDRLADDRGRPARRRRRLLPHQRAVPGVRGGVHPGRPALQGRRRRALLRAPRGPRRAGLPAGAGQPGRHASTCGGSSTSPSAASATGPRRASRRSPSASGSRSPRRCARPTRRPGSPPAR